MPGRGAATGSDFSSGAPFPVQAWERYRAFLSRTPEMVLEWSDSMTEARGWLVINSLRGGAAGGGTRMRPGVTREEVVHLAKTMELKFAFSGPPIGGAKSGLAFDPEDPRRLGVLERWFHAIRPFLESCYGTAGDVGVDEQRDVVPLCAALGLEHPQQGIVTGYLRPGAGGVRAVHERLRAGLALPVTSPDLGVAGGAFRVSDLVTGYGAARAAIRLLESLLGTAEGARAVVEGFGNVGGATALYLARAGVRIVGLVDAQGGISAPDGLEPEAVEALLRNRAGRILPPNPLLRSGVERERVYSTPADLFVPAAVSGSLDRGRLQQLEAAGVQAIVCGANQPFRESAPGASAVLEDADALFSVVVDAVASMGMARCFDHLMEGAPELSDRVLFDDVGRQVDGAVDRVLARAGEPTGLAAAALEEGLARLG